MRFDGGGDYECIKRLRFPRGRCRGAKIMSANRGNGDVKIYADSLVGVFHAHNSGAEGATKVSTANNSHA